MTDTTTMTTMTTTAPALAAARTFGPGPAAWDLPEAHDLAAAMSARPVAELRAAAARALVATCELYTMPGAARDAARGRGVDTDTCEEVENMAHDILHGGHHSGPALCRAARPCPKAVRMVVRALADLM